MRNLSKIPLMFALLTFSSPAFAIDESVQTVESRGVEQRFVLTKPDQPPVASVILFAGGHGGLRVSSFLGSTAFGWGEKNFVVRTRDLYAKKGLLVATIDTPSDRKNMNAGWRMGKKHADDVAAVVAYLKQQANVPVWIVGTSMGSISAANIAIRLRDRIEGAVFTSSITQSDPRWKIANDYPNGIIDMELAKVTDPVFVVSHENDQCRVSPPANTEKLAKGFSNSKHVEHRLFSGGDAPISDPCEALSQHGFLGIEDKVVDAIAAFIKAN